MATSLKRTEKTVRSVIYGQIPIPYCENLVKIGPVDHDSILLKCLFKNEEINASRTHRGTCMPSGLNYKAWLEVAPTTLAQRT